MTHPFPPLIPAEAGIQAEPGPCPLRARLGSRFRGNERSL
jgi:hypothetical protein